MSINIFAIAIVILGTVLIIFNKPLGLLIDQAETPFMKKLQFMNPRERILALAVAGVVAGALMLLYSER